ncbi:zinc metallo proteinase [Colletotrichum navitas]|uniref:Zinc metallo proteinase n=1 Tax=Colletotrichum navitas TaxID=681940 RepID=A0AAD8PIN3_9PEZI|nr:zinc metallo proteinase [Colletotrichum navitas]KAK1561719.1 zinc metallo proteinase [Colletotrichum navitas]
MPQAKRQCVQVPRETAADTKSPLTIENLHDGETVHERCIIIKGYYTTTMPWNDFITISSSDGNTKTFPSQTWPLVASCFKAMALLSPGRNILTITRCSTDTENPAPSTLTLNYIPLLQTPPLHLAIMIAKDSPLLIDCPPSKYGPLSTAHSSLDAAVAKMRMAAYMWQAFTAEDMRMKGLGRRSFRLEEEFAADTTSQVFMSSYDDSSAIMRSTAKVHIVRSSRTVAELRDADVAQQNEAGRNRNKLFDYFLDALASYGGPFETSLRPVVAGMLLDSHFSTKQHMILGHAALGCHNPEGVSLGIMGSHLAYSFPRFLEEVVECLLDTRAPGRTVGNDNDECHSFWEACCVGQGAFLHEVGHAFGAPHTTGIMARGYSRHWARNFLAKTAQAAHEREEEAWLVNGDANAQNDATWDLRDALSFRMLPHFWMPGDKKVAAEARASAPFVSVVNPESDTDDAGIEIYCAAGIATISFNGELEEEPHVAEPYKKVVFGRKELEGRFDPEEELKVYVLGMNGKTKTVRNLWKAFATEHIRIPGSDIVLRKRSVTSKDLEESDEGDDKFWSWATLLTRKDTDGNVLRASNIDVRTGCILDGAYVEFPDGTKVNCGPRISSWGRGGTKHEFGGHAAENVRMPNGKEIVSVEVARGSHILYGMRIHFENGTAGGALSGYTDEPREETLALEVQAGDRIVGFYGRSWWGKHFDGLVEFGIITAPKGVDLPDQVYKMKELQNTDGGQSVSITGRGFWRELDTDTS